LFRFPILVSCPVPGYILAHKLTYDLRCGLVLLATGIQKLLTEFSLDTDAKAYVFHRSWSVSNGYTFVEKKLGMTPVPRDQTENECVNFVSGLLDVPAMFC
jgi:hypothetical protein